jgi:nucleoside-diphosphate-sugar epimerase
VRVLVSGAGGFLGRYMVDRLLKGGHRVRAIIRPATNGPEWTGDVEIFRADLRVDDRLVEAFDGVDAVLHLAAATSGGEDEQFASSVVATERFVDAMARSSVKRLIHVSSLVVYDWRYAKPVMDEDTPLLTDMYGMGAYTIAKIWQERVIKRASLANSWHLTIMRPGFIWSAERMEIAGMGRLIGGVSLMYGPFTRLPLSHVVNCADCLAVAVENPASVGETFNVIDGDEVRVLRYVRGYVRQTGQKKLLVPVPYRVGYGLAHMALLTSRLLFGEKGNLPSLLIPRRFESQFKPIRFSNQKLRKVLSWTPPLSFDECLSSYRAPKWTISRA